MSNLTYARNPFDLCLDQQFAYQCDMLIWPSAFGLGALDHPGHASLVLRRTREEGPWRYDGSDNGGRRVVPDLDRSKYVYVSFWPFMMNGIFEKSSCHFYPHHLEDFRMELGDTGRQMLEKSQTAPRRNQIVIGSTDWANDIWGQRCDVIVSSPGMNGAALNRLGLDLNRIVDWVVRFRTSDDFNYIFGSKKKNCAGVAVEAMRAGGADAFASIAGAPARPAIYMLPNDAEQWARAVRRGIDSCNAMLELLRNRTAHLPPGPYDLMSVSQWKSASHVAFAIRGRMTSAIDVALKSFHEKQWSQDFPGKLKALVTIIKNTHDHLRAESRREDAYLTLAREILGVVNWLGRSADAPWNPTDFYGRVEYFGAPKGKA